MKIAYLCLWWIGDALMQTPSLRVLREAYPDAQIDAIALSWWAGYAVQTTGYCDSIHVFNLLQAPISALFQLVKLAWKERYDVSILAFPAYRREYHIVSFILGAKRRIAHRFASGYWSECTFLETDLVPVDESKHNVINNLELLRVLGIDWTRVYPDISKIRYILNLWESSTVYGQKYFHDHGLEGQRVVGIHPGSTNSPAALLRRWGVSNYLELIGGLCHKGYSVLIFWWEDEREEIDFLEKALKTNPYCRIIRGISFENTLGIISRLDMMITNDNGFWHISAALSIPLISLWWSTNSSWSGPMWEDVRIIRKAKFDPWYRYELKRSIPEWALSGMGEIQVEDVIERVS